MALAAPDLDLRTRLFIDGEFVDAEGGARFTTENPATGQPIAEVAEGGLADVDRAVRAARAAVEHGPWSTMAPAERKRVLQRVADAIDAHTDELALIESLDAGKPIEDCRTIDIPDTANTIRWHAEAIDKLNDDVSPTGRDALAMVVHEPVGVVGAVIPWNYPALMAAWKLGPASRPAMRRHQAGQLYRSEPPPHRRAGHGRRPAAGRPQRRDRWRSTVGQAIGRHPDIDAVAFTGSTEVGRDFLHYAAESNLKRVMLELGGKSPQIVMRDVSDLDNPSPTPPTRSSGTWARTARRVADDRPRVAPRRGRRPAGRPRRARVDRRRPARSGDADRRARLEGSHGARARLRRDRPRRRRAVVTGGARTREDSGGWFVQPTIFDGATTTCASRARRSSGRSSRS